MWPCENRRPARNRVATGTMATHSNDPDYGLSSAAPAWKNAKTSKVPVLSVQGPNVVPIRGCRRLRTANAGNTSLLLHAPQLFVGGGRSCSVVVAASSTGMTGCARARGTVVTARSGTTSRCRSAAVSSMRGLPGHLPPRSTTSLLAATSCAWACPTPTPTATSTHAAPAVTTAGRPRGANRKARPSIARPRLICRASRG
jgi:hypothetical protein